MRRLNGILIVLALGLTALLAHAAEPTTKPSAGGGRLFVPYSKMTTLSDDQKTKIRDIHKKVLADIREIEKKQSQEIEALLSDDQKKELKTIEDGAAKKPPAAKKDEEGEK